MSRPKKIMTIEISRGSAGQYIIVRENHENGYSEGGVANEQTQLEIDALVNRLGPEGWNEV